MFIYRVEDKLGNGPYKELNDSWQHSDKRNRPLPWDDGLDMDVINYAYEGLAHYGFSSKEQIFKWFSIHDIINLKSLGYKLRKVEAYKIWNGNNQVIFVKKWRNY